MVSTAKYERLVVPLDGSRLAELAIPWARMIAEKSHAEVELVTSVRHVTVPADSGLDHDSGESHLWASAELSKYGVRASTNVLAGNPAQAIKALAHEKDAGLIVMATHGRSGVSRRLLGSVTDRILHISNVPVLVVRVSAERSPLAGSPPGTIILPVDGSEASQAALPVAAGFAEMFDANVLLVHAVQSNGPGEHGEPVLSNGESMKSQLAGMVKTLGDRGIEAEPSFSYLDPKSAIVTASKSLPESLIVMASIGSTGIGKSRRGNVADHVIHHALAPVVVVPPRGFLGPVLE